MGGYGSGSWHRNRSHKTVDAVPEFYAIDFKKLQGFVLARARDELAHESVRFRYIRNGRMVLLFFQEQDRIDGENYLAPIIKIVSTPCSFGGEREWLLCPEQTCGRRVRSLFVDEHYRIACRKCLGLLYESQYGGVFENNLARIRTINRKFGRGMEGDVLMNRKLMALFHSVISDLKKIDRTDL